MWEKKKLLVKSLVSLQRTLKLTWVETAFRQFPAFERTNVSHASTGCYINWILWIQNSIKTYLVLCVKDMQ